MTPRSLSGTGQPLLDRLPVPLPPMLKDAMGLGELPNDPVEGRYLAVWHECGNFAVSNGLTTIAGAAINHHGWRLFTDHPVMFTIQLTLRRRGFAFYDNGEDEGTPSKHRYLLDFQEGALYAGTTEAVMSMLRPDETVAPCLDAPEPIELDAEELERIQRELESAVVPESEVHAQQEALREAMHGLRAWLKDVLDPIWNSLAPASLKATTPAGPPAP